MPQRHLIIISLTAIFSIACYEISFHQRVASVVAEAARLMKKEGLYEVDDQLLTKSAVDGMLNQIDQFSGFYAGEEAKSQKEILKQEYHGLGINIRRDQKTGNVWVLRPFWGSPAMEAGLLPGDLITAVDGTPFHVDEKMEDVFKKLRGPEGSKVELTIRRKLKATNEKGEKLSDPKKESDQSKELKVTVERKSIKTRSVFGYQPNSTGGWKYILPGEKKIGYIRVDKFGERTSSELRKAVGDIKDDIQGLIIDLRNNPGGYLGDAIEISDMFLTEKGKTIVMQKDRHAKTVGIAVSEDPPVIPDSIPLAILINEKSASASEIVSACLQDHGRAVVIGQRSFGKGTVQSFFPMSLPGSFLKLTTATYWRPSQKNIHRMRLRDPKRQEEYDKKNPASDWGVKPNPGYEIPLSRIDSLELATMRSNQEIGLPIDDVTQSMLDYIKEAEDKIMAQKYETSKDKLPDWEFENKIHWKDGKDLIQRDVQLQKAIDFFYESKTKEKEVEKEKSTQR